MRILRLALGLSVIGIAVVASWMLLDTAFHATGDYAFCTGCHAYAPIAAAYREDTHGGNNTAGFRAACNDCHLPHDNSLNYFLVKARHGVVDPVMEILKDPHEIDWHGIREHRESFVYDSGCLACHKNLEQVSERAPKTFLAHRSYFKNPKDHRCVGCHQHVGHKRLGYHLERMGWPPPRGEGQ